MFCPTTNPHQSQPFRSLPSAKMCSDYTISAPRRDLIVTIVQKHNNYAVKNLAPRFDEFRTDFPRWKRIWKTERNDSFVPKCLQMMGQYFYQSILRAFSMFWEPSYLFCSLVLKEIIQEWLLTQMNRKIYFEPPESKPVMNSACPTLGQPKCCACPTAKQSVFTL